MAGDATLELPPAAPATWPRTLLVGTAFGLAGMAMYFVGILGIYAFTRNETLAGGAEWIPSGTIEVAPGVMMWFTSLMSVVTMQWAVYALTRSVKAQAYLALFLTFVFGIAIINQTAFYLDDMGLGIADSTAATLLHVIVWSHIVLLVAAMVLVGLVSFRALAGQYAGRNPDGIMAAAMVWYLAVAVYSALWILIYVTK